MIKGMAEEIGRAIMEEMGIHTSILEVSSMKKLAAGDGSEVYAFVTNDGNLVSATIERKAHGEIEKIKINSHPIHD